MKAANGLAMSGRAQSILISLLLLAAFWSYPYSAAQATIDPEFVCTPPGSPTGSKCKAITLSAWRWATGDPNVGDWFNSEEEMQSAIKGVFALSTCSVGNPQDSAPANTPLDEGCGIVGQNPLGRLHVPSSTPLWCRRLTPGLRQRTADELPADLPTPPGALRVARGSRRPAGRRCPGAGWPTPCGRPGALDR